MTIEQHAHVPEEVDVVVIGAGAGGLAAAAWLVKAGYRILVVEAKPQVGGRASTEPIDGFGGNTGAQIFELGGANKALFDDVGIPIRARKQPVPLILRLGRRDVQVMSGITGFLANKIGIPVIGGLARRFGWFRPKEGIFLDTWLDQLHAPVKIKRLCRNLTSALFAAEPSDVIATLFFDYLTKKGGMNTYGAHPDGSIGPWQDLAAGIQRAGGTILLDTSVTAIGVGDDGRADTVVIRKTDGATVTVRTRAVISNIGPVATSRLVPAEAWPADDREKLEAESFPGTLITINFASEQPIPNLTTLVFFGYTERLAYASYMSGPSPSLAPAGWHLYCVTSTPHPANTGFDLDEELAILRREAAREFPESARAREVSIANCTGDWPGQRAIPGRDWPNATPIQNLWNVGDAARPWMAAGQSGCVESARIAVDALIATGLPASHLRD